MNLENLLDKLLRESKIKKQDTDINYLNGLLGSARQNFQKNPQLELFNF